ncbi:MAG: pyridoxamine 5'-phosphate oxidase family protein [Burkholderiaceae bacterium]|nr:pyridoxamine 5'-phosphate oxidase family protein [Burkholderiaceae bacterium]
MTALDPTARELLEKAEFVAIVTQGPDGPHLVGNWGDYARRIGIDDERIIFPAGHYERTEQNLMRDSRIQLMAASRAVRGSRGPGQGGVIHGRGSVQAEGEFAARAKAVFPWARGALVIEIERCEMQL